MNYLVQRGKVRQQVINVPEGLPELLSDITREVLRCQPTTECLCQFIIDYLHSIIVTREKANMAKAIIERAMRTVDEIISDMCICDIPAIKAEELAMAMEECFKRFLEKRRCERRKEHEIVKFSEWDMLDELIEKCHFTEHDLAMSRPIIEDAYNRFVEAYMAAAEDTNGTEALYEYFKQREIKRLEDERMDEAAIKIQAAYRGYVVRNKLFMEKTELPEDDEYYDDEKVRAAIKIQRFWRRLKSLEEYGICEGEEEQMEECSSIELCTPKSMLSATTDQKSTISAPTKTEKAETEAEAEGAAGEQPESAPAAVPAAPETEPAEPEVVPDAEQPTEPEPAPMEPEPAAEEEPEAPAAAEPAEEEK